MPKGSPPPHPVAACEADIKLIRDLYERVWQLQEALNALTLAAQFWRAPTEAEFRRQQRAIHEARTVMEGT